MAARGPSHKRLTGLMVFCIGVGGVVIGRAGLIQVMSNQRLERLAQRQFQSHVLIRPRRGAILDRNGEPLAINVETNSLAANPAKIQNKRILASLISKAT